MTEWQPIETAYFAGVMHNNSRVLLLTPPYGAGSGHWDGLKWVSHFCINKGANPTHWMPLPPPPTTEGEE